MKSRRTTKAIKVEKNHDYTISVIDSKSRELRFRDIRGSDLEFLDHVFKYDFEDNTKQTSLSFDDVCEILNLLMVKPSDFRISRLTRREISSVFESVRENILLNYMPKVIWLKYCYGIQNASFANLEHMESVPMSKFTVMVEIHKEAIAQINSDPPGE